MLGVVAFVLAVMCKRMQQLPILLGPAVHRVKTLETMCNARERPQQRWRSCVNGSNIVALRFGNHGTKECWLKILTGLELSATTPNNTQQDVTGYANGRNMQHPTMLGVVGQQCCVRLHGALGCC